MRLENISGKTCRFLKSNYLLVVCAITSRENKGTTNLCLKYLKKGQMGTTSWCQRMGARTNRRSVVCDHNGNHQNFKKVNYLVY